MTENQTTGEPFSRITQSVASSGQVVVTADSPAEIASWYFPHDDDEEMRERLKLDIEGIIERRIAEAFTNGR